MAALLALTGVAAAAQPAQASSRTVTLRSGPIVVDGYAVRYGTTRVPSVGVNGHITSMHARVVDRAGRRVPVARMMLHHITFIDLGRPVRAMGILHVYVAPSAPGGAPAPRCSPTPLDIAESQQKPSGLTSPPAVTVPLTRIGPDGRARIVDAPAGPSVELDRPQTYTIDIRRPRLSPATLVVPVGTRLRWRFSDSTRHDVTVADGPLGFSSLPSAHGATFSRPLATPGVYKLFCSLHPVKMSQRVVVRP